MSPKKNIRSKKALKAQLLGSFDNYERLLDEVSYGLDRFILAKDPDNYSAHNLCEFMNSIDDEETASMMQYTPEVIHFLSKTIPTGKIRCLTVYDSYEFFSNPILVLSVKAALDKFDPCEFYIEFEELEEFLPSDVMEFIEPLTYSIDDSKQLFNLLELIHAMISFHDKHGMSLEIYDMFYDELSKLYDECPY